MVLIGMPYRIWCDQNNPLALQRVAEHPSCLPERQSTLPSPCAGRYKLFNLSKAYNKGLSQSDVQQMATSVLLAALSILPYEHRDKDRTEADSELEKERSVRMATILGFSVDTKRNARWLLLPLCPATPCQVLSHVL